MMLDGQKLRRAREDRGWSQADLACATNLSRSFVSQLESGARGTSPKTGVHIAAVLSIEVDHLRLDYEESPVLCAECGKRVYDVG